jgi:hypothetical protein
MDMSEEKLLGAPSKRRVLLENIHLIRKSLKAGHTARSIAKALGVTPKAITDIADGKTYAWVK